MDLPKRLATSAVAIALGLPGLWVFSGNLPPTDARRPARSEAFAALPLSFEINRGQAAAGVRFLARGIGYTVLLTDNQVVYVFTGGAQNENPTPAVVRMTFLGSNPSPRISGRDELPGKTSYFIGDDPRKWLTNIPTYAKLEYANVYPGVDVLYYGHSGRFQFDLLLAASVDPGVVEITFEGVVSLEAASNGDLVLGTELGPMRLSPPVAYQVINESNHMIPARYVSSGERQVTFQLDEFDRSRPLIIDPQFTHPIYLGGTDREQGRDIAVDSSGNLYVTGSTRRADFRTIFSPFGDRAPTDVFIMKVNTAGTAILYSSYIGGSEADTPAGIAVDAAGHAYLTGQTTSRDFPTSRPFDPEYAGGECARGEPPFPTLCSDAFVARLNAQGADLVYSTYLGGPGDDVSTAITVDRQGNAHVAGWTESWSFPTVNAFQSKMGGGWTDAFLTKFDPAGTALYSTYMGGSFDDSAQGVAVDLTGNAYVAGTTNSADFPTARALESFRGGSCWYWRPPVGNPPFFPAVPCDEAFASKLNPAGTALVFSTFLGGSGARGIAADPAGSVYVADASQITKLTADGSSRVYSTKLGHTVNDLAVDGSGNAYVTGPAVAKLNSIGQVVSSGFPGGEAIAADAQGNAYVTGTVDQPGSGADNPFLRPGELYSPFTRGTDAFVAKFVFPDDFSRAFVTYGKSISFVADAGSRATRIGFARVQPNKTATPAGLAILGYRQNDVLVAETVLEGSIALRSGRIYAEAGNSVRMGLAFANPNAQPATVSFFFTDLDGKNFGDRSITIPTNGQIAGFLDEQPFSDGSSSINGTFTFNSPLPVGIAALRVLTNERLEFLMTTLPVAELSAQSGKTVTIPHFADGGGWKTQLVLVNPSDDTIEGTIQFFGQGTAAVAAEPVALTLDGRAGDSFTYVLPPRSSRRFRTSGSNPQATIGSIRISTGTQSPSAFSIPSFKPGGVTLSEMSVPAGPTGTVFRTYVEYAGNFTARQPGSISSGIAVRNLSAAPVSLDVTSPYSESVIAIPSRTIVIPGNGQAMIFPDEIFSPADIPRLYPLDSPFQGVLGISVRAQPGTSSNTARRSVAAIGLRRRYNERQELLVSAVPAIEEAFSSETGSVSAATELLFPHFAVGGGYGVQFILLPKSRADSLSGISGTLRLVGQSGQPLNLTLR